MRFVDLSAPIEPSAPDVPELMRVEISHTHHSEGAEQIHELFGVGEGLLRDGLLRDGPSA